jgi:hypothetical protein
MMKPLLVGCIALTASAALSLSAQAAPVTDEHFDFDTTADLYRVCATPSDAPEYTVASFSCRAFIEATVQYHDSVSGKRQMKPLVCYPSGTNIADGRSTFVSWAEANQNNQRLMGELPVVGVVRALAAKYPCR